jgi:hypothetical protein
MTTRTNWILALAILAAAAWGFAGCAHGPATVEQTENVGQLAAGPSVYSAPMKHDAPPELGFVAGSDDVSSVATTVTRANSPESPDGSAPEVEAKVAHGF